MARHAVAVSNGETLSHTRFLQVRLICWCLGRSPISFLHRFHAGRGEPGCFGLAKQLREHRRGVRRASANGDNVPLSAQPSP
ncbi:hypothetical protein J167_03536 [Xanthomonas citri pv. citri]|nr:hypothetical protein J166_03535 [Xanthomonas citri pv. citri]AJZ54865.1 hypothetical protein J167_03536 [Xanthomonas citri pv. citri]EWC51420.1 hypothetical protein XAR_2406 [Xanthomonas citri pv. glycines str. 8ra]